MMRIICLFLAFTLYACQTAVVPVSSRNIDGVVERQYLAKSRSIRGLEEVKPPEIFVRKNKIVIEKVYEEDTSGSLFNLNNPENYLFYDKPRGAIGDSVKVFVRINRGAENENQPENPELPPDQLENELIAALPQLEPSDAKPVVVTKITFKVLRRLQNGDAIVEHYRNSKTADESRVLIVQARIPRSSLLANAPITTDDLKDVVWYQNINSEVSERKSIAWQDEYTLRISGFDEAKSRQALELEAKRKDLQSVRDRLQQRIVNLGRERQNVARERDRVGKEKSELDKTVGTLKSQISEKESIIEEQKAVIKRQQELIDGAGPEAAPPAGG